MQQCRDYISKFPRSFAHCWMKSTCAGSKKSKTNDYTFILPPKYWPALKCLCSKLTRKPPSSSPFLLCLLLMGSSVEQPPPCFSSLLPFFDSPLSHPPYLPPASIVHVCSSFLRVNSISSHTPAVTQAFHPASDRRADGQIRSLPPIVFAM